MRCTITGVWQKEACFLFHIFWVGDENLSFCCFYFCFIFVFWIGDDDMFVFFGFFFTFLLLCLSGHVKILPFFCFFLFECLQEHSRICSKSVEWAWYIFEVGGVGKKQTFLTFEIYSFIFLLLYPVVPPHCCWYLLFPFKCHLFVNFVNLK